MQPLRYRGRVASMLRGLLLVLCLVVVTAVASPAPAQEPRPAGLAREYRQHSRRFHRAKRHRVARRSLPKVHPEWRQPTK
jgi:hypothetical protein